MIAMPMNPDVVPGVANDPKPVAEPGFPQCGCFDCAHPTPQNVETRLVHRERHWDFALRYCSPPSEQEKAMWKIVAGFAELADRDGSGR